MRCLTLFVSLFLISLSATAGGDYFDAQVIELKEKGGGKYAFTFIQKSQPFGKDHVKDEELTVHLEFMCPRKNCISPTLGDYKDSIRLLKSQIKESKNIKFGVMGKGYKKISDSDNEYQSRASKIHDGVVYSYYDF